MTTHSSARIRSLAAVALVALVTSSCAQGSMQGTAGGDVATDGTTSGTVSGSAGANLSAWPAKQRETVMKMMSQYGQPDVMSEQMVAWFDKGPFIKTVITRKEVPHNFPMPHVDYLMQTVGYQVPTDKYDELAEYDGSVVAHRTRGELSAQCDVEAMNLLALNLAHDVATGKRTVQDARAFYAKTAMAFKQGDTSSPYTQGLMFESRPNANDADRPFSGM